MAPLWVDKYGVHLKKEWPSYVYIRSFIMKEAVALENVFLCSDLIFVTGCESVAIFSQLYFSR